MGVRFELHPAQSGHPAKILVTDLISVQAIDRGYFGQGVEGKKIHLQLAPEEALYLMDVRNAECTQGENTVTFNQVAEPFEGKKFLARYFCYRDWRDRGLIPQTMTTASGPYGRSPIVKYPSGTAPKLRVKESGFFYHDDLMSVIDDNDAAREVYEQHWFGQYGTYKAKKHGQFVKLDAYETLYLMRHAGFSLNVSEKKLVALAKKRRSDFSALYDVYEDWRNQGYVPKTGFKFGTHFRLYFPGAKPTLEDAQWMHSKHVIQVFPRESRLLISEWARAIRVAHGVKKTFILAIPGAHAKKADLDFLLYHRKGGDIENPRHDKPSFAMLALSEEEEIGGEELASAISHAKDLGLDLVLGICDRETAVTYYRVKRVELPHSPYEYYEIEWFQP